MYTIISKKKIYYILKNPVSLTHLLFLVLPITEQSKDSL